MMSFSSTLVSHFFFSFFHKLIPPNLNKKYATRLNIRVAYTAPYPPHPPTPSHIDTTPIRKFLAAWTPTDFIYTYGSQITGNPTLSASVVDPKHNTITHIEIKSQPERHTINRAELAAITTALDLYIGTTHPSQPSQTVQSLLTTSETSPPNHTPSTTTKTRNSSI